MAADSNIEWTDDTLNWWWGCTKVSPACTHCYAETLNARFDKADWTRDGRRTPVKGAPKLLQSIVRKAVAEQRQRRVFVSSMSDFFEDRPDLCGMRTRAWVLMREAAAVRLDDGRPCVRFLLLTKRPEVALCWNAEHGWIDGAWLGVTVEDQKRADERIPVALNVGVPLFLSMEPLLGPVNLAAISGHTGPGQLNALTGMLSFGPGMEVGWGGSRAPANKVRWVIAGGESGPRARPSHPDWFRSLRDQCAQAVVPFFFKQWGVWMPTFCGIDPNDGDPTCRIRSATTYSDGQTMWMVGKKAAGRLLDGRLHDEVPVG